MKLIEDQCFWCAEFISRPSINLLWLDDYESAGCVAHPSQLVGAPHQTLSWIRCLVAQIYKDKVTPLQAVDRNVVSIARNASRTSRSVGKSVLPHTGSIRRRVYDLVVLAKHNGHTDAELEVMLNGKHQTISASRRSLVRDGWLVDSGKVRRNNQANECIVWVSKSQSHNIGLFDIKENA